MKNFLRISLFVCILVGGAFASKIWATREFTAALRPFDDVLLEQPAMDNQNQLAAAILSQDTQYASTTPGVAVEDNFSFVFPPKGALLYQGCTYPISWTASTTIRSIGLSLVDAGTRNAVSGGQSGIPEEKKIDNDRDILKNLPWKVSWRVWPGTYFLELTSLNASSTTEKSYRFEVGGIPEGTLPEEIQTLCKNTGGNL